MLSLQKAGQGPRCLVYHSHRQKEVDEGSKGSCNSWTGMLAWEVGVSRGLWASDWTRCIKWSPRARQLRPLLAAPRSRVTGCWREDSQCWPTPLDPEGATPRSPQGHYHSHRRAILSGYPAPPAAPSSPKVRGVPRRGYVGSEDQLP